MKLTEHQQAAAQANQSMIVLRWGRQTGKDTLINELIDIETDFVIMPQNMAAQTAEKWEGWSVFQDRLVNKEVLHFIKRRQKKHHRTKRIFLNECAFFDVELMPLIKLLREEWPKAQIYLISTPRGGWKLFEAGMPGLEFDMFCARLEMGKLHDWYYSRQGAIGGDQDAYKELGEQQLTQEYYAGWWDIV